MLEMLTNFFRDTRSVTTRVEPVLNETPEIAEYRIVIDEDTNLWSYITIDVDGNEIEAGVFRKKYEAVEAAKALRESRGGDQTIYLYGRNGKLMFKTY